MSIFYVQSRKHVLVSALNMRTSDLALPLHTHIRRPHLPPLPTLAVQRVMASFPTIFGLSGSLGGDSEREYMAEAYGA